MNAEPALHITLAGAQTTGSWRARVHSIFANAVNIIADGRRLTLLSNADWISENNMIFSSRDIFPLIQPAASIHTNGQGFYINGIRVAAYPAQAVWKMPVLPKKSIAPHAMEPVTSFLAESTSDTLTQMLEKQFQASIHHFFTHQTADFSRVIGAGHGLTPSGDDMLVGFALAVFCYRTEAMDELGKCCQPYLENTTDISRYLLLDALSGRFTAPLTNLLLALQHGQNIGHAIKTAAQIGSTSGKDGIFGLYHGLQLFHAAHKKQ